MRTDPNSPSKVDHQPSRHFFLFLLVVTTLTMLHPGAATADGSSTDPRSDTSSIPKVVSAGSTSEQRAIGLAQGITVSVRGAVELSPVQLRSSQKHVVLFIDGRQLDGVYPVRNTINKFGAGSVDFYIPRSEAAVALWDDLISVHRRFRVRVPVSIGLENGDPIPTDDDGVEIALAHQYWFFGVMTLVTILFIFVLVLALRTDLLRDSGSRNWADNRRASYSLARVTCVVWTVSIVAAWLVLYVFKHTMDTIPDSMVGLMGISAGTTLSARTLEDGRPSATVSRGFVTDLLSDNGLLDFQRFQLLVWTVVTNVVFWRQVILYFEMPKFPSEILILMGISSASYLGSKLPGVQLRSTTNTETALASQPLLSIPTPTPPLGAPAP